MKEKKRIEEKEKIKKTMIKEKYKEHYIKLLGSEEEYELFINKALDYAKRSIRVNTLKITVKELKERLEKKGWSLKQIDYIKEGFFIEKEERRDIGNLEEHASGYFYVQEASSMIPPLVLNPKKHTLTLDIAAAPGSKTTQIAALKENTGLIIANEIDYNRISALKANLERIGVYNTIITNKDGRNLNFKTKFDQILLDAPCSGTGTLSKSLKSLTMWNPKGLERLQRLQLQLLEKAYSLLKEKGTLVYSTCSLEVEENELVLHEFLKKYETAKTLNPNINIKNSSKPYEEYKKREKTINIDSRVKKAIRLWPHKTNTDGFFIIKIKKQ